MHAKDIMTSPVITVAPDTSVREIAELLYARRISAVPVTEDGRLVGLVSEADLMRRREIETDRPPPSRWWLRLFDDARAAEDYVKSHARHARDIMTREVVTVAPETDVAEVAALLEGRGIKRVPVVKDGRPVGIVSRSNLVQALASTQPQRAQPRGDDAIRAALLAELGRQPWWQRNVANVIVTDGVVHFWGTIDNDEERAAARVAAENIPGVRGVEDHRFNIHALPVSV